MGIKVIFESNFTVFDFNKRHRGEYFCVINDQFASPMVEVVGRYRYFIPSNFDTQKPLNRFFKVPLQDRKYQL